MYIINSIRVLVWYCIVWYCYVGVFIMSHMNLCIKIIISTINLYNLGLLILTMILINIST